MQSEVDLKGLQQLGLTERESRTYFALVAHGPTPPHKIHALSGIAPSKIYETLHRLVQLGLVTERPVYGRKVYEAVRPDDAVQHLLTRREMEMETCREIGSRIEEQMMTVFNRSREVPSAQEYFSFLQNPAQILRVLDELQDRCTSEILWFVKAPYSADRTNEAGIAALRRGVRSRAIYEPDDILGEKFARRFGPFIEAGEEMRVHQSLAIKLVIFDCRTSLFQFVDENFPQHRTTVAIENRSIALAFTVCFESYWRESVPLATYLRQHESPLPPQDGPSASL